MLETLLQNQGLSEKKITIYKLLCDLGEQPASSIAKKVGLNRSSCYQHLDQLLSMGFISRIIKNNITYFSANDILGVLDNLKGNYSRQLRQIDALKLTLHSERQKQQKLKRNSKAHFCSGGEPLRQLLKQSLPATEATNKVFICANSSFDSEWMEILNEQLQLLEKSKTPTQLITVKKPNFQSPKFTDQKNLTAHFDIGIDLIVLKDRVVLLSPSEEFGIQIDSHVIASATSKIFSLFWKIAKN